MEDFEERYAALRATAKEQGSEISLAVTVGGIRIDELYLVTPFAKQFETLDEQLNQMAEVLADPRHAAAAKATRLMVETEGLAKATIELAKTRQEEYKVAVEAFRSITVKDTEAVDRQQRFLTSAASVARYPDLFDVMLDELDKRKEKREENVEPEQEPTDG